MDSRLFSLLNRLNSLKQSKHRFPESLIPKNPISNRTYYTSRSRKISLYNKISPLGDPNTSVVPELDNWVQNGNKVRVAELQRIIRDLRKRKRFSQALEVRHFLSRLFVSRKLLIGGLCFSLPEVDRRNLIYFTIVLKLSELKVILDVEHLKN